MALQNTILIAGGEKEPLLLAGLEDYYTSQGWQVCMSEAIDNSHIQDDIHRYTAGGQTLNAFMYISPPPRRGSMLDDDPDIITSAMNGDLETGLWWVQSACKKMVEQGVPGRVVTLAHITALVPTEYYSYGAAGQLALMNLCRSGMQELVAHGIKINTIFRGFTQEDPQQKRFVEQLRELHKEDGIPLLEFTSVREIAKTSALLTDPLIQSFNGATLTLDGGFYVTRKIRYLDPVKQ